MLLDLIQISYLRPNSNIRLTFSVKLQYFPSSASLRERLRDLLTKNRVYLNSSLVHETKYRKIGVKRSIYKRLLVIHVYSIFLKKCVWRNEKEPFAAVSARFYCESEHLTRFMSRKYLNSCFCVNSDQIPMKPPLNCSPNFTILQIYIHGIYTGWHNLRDFHGDWLRILCTEF